MKKIYDVIIIGAGPAGLMCAKELNKEIKYTILEKNSSPGKKLLLTGGGRCNVTNNLSNKEFIESCYNNKFIHSMINKFGPKEVRDFFEKNNVPLKEETSGKIFPISNKSVDILNVLTNDSNITYNENVIDIIKDNNKYIVNTKNNIYECKYLVIAVGGSSFKITGSSGDSLKFSKMLKQPFVNFYPCEVNLITTVPYLLAGTSVNYVKVKCGEAETTGSFMFTHTGLSGEAIMKISEYTKDNNTIVIDLIPTKQEEELLHELQELKEKELVTFYNKYFTKKFSTFLNEDNKKIKSLSEKKKLEIVNNLKKYQFNNVKTDFLDKAYVTGGGIDMKSIHSTTLESKTNSNLYFIGETLDIHGPIGGFNITLALSGGYISAESINKKLNQKGSVI